MSLSRLLARFPVTRFPKKSFRVSMLRGCSSDDSGKDEKPAWPTGGGIGPVMQPDLDILTGPYPPYASGLGPMTPTPFEAFVDRKTWVTGMDIWSVEKGPVVFAKGIVGLKICFSDGSSKSYGLTKASDHDKFQLADGEKISVAQVAIGSGQMVEHLAFFTNNNKKYGPYPDEKHDAVHGSSPSDQFWKLQPYLVGVKGEVLQLLGGAGIANLQFMWAFPPSF